MFLLRILALFSFLELGFDPFEQTQNAIREGKYQPIIEQVGNAIDLTLGDRSGLYTKAQAEEVLKHFFANHPPRSVNIAYKGSQVGGLRYAIGTMTSVYSENYKLYILIREKDNKVIIQELRFQLQ